jgi:hypothetical protein
MDTTANLNLPFIMAAQAQKHVTHNEGLRALDAIVQLAVVDKDLSTPPASPTEGACYIVAASPTGAWTGQTGNIAAYQDAAWAFYTPREGWLAWAADEDTLYAWTGSAWALFAGGGGGLGSVADDITPQLGGDLDADGHDIGFDDGTGITDDTGNEQIVFHKAASAVNQIGITNAATGNAPQIAAEGADTNIDLTLAGKGTGHPKAALFGVNATADATTKFAVAAAASLFNHAGAGHQHKINKNAASDTASLLFQTGTSGRAEMGTAGDDDFHVKVSADGSTWKEAILVNRSSGAVSLPLTPKRELLLANRTYYVRTDGNDSNDGLTNTSGSAFLTIQKAIDTVAALDLSIYDVTIQVADGTYTGAVGLKSTVGSGRVTLQGNNTTPANVVISTTSANAVTAAGISGLWTLKSLKLQTATSGNALSVTDCVVSIDNLNFGATAAGGIHIVAARGTVLILTGYAVSGSASSHMFADTNATIYLSGGITVTLTGTPAFSIFASALKCSVIRAIAITFSGSATGSRYSVVTNAVIDTGGGGANYFPGNSAGSTATGGQYA